MFRHETSNSTRAAPDRAKAPTGAASGVKGKPPRDGGWLESSWDTSENNRRAKYYTLTKAGQRQLGEEQANWNRIALAMARALEG